MLSVLEESEESLLLPGYPADQEVFLHAEELVSLPHDGGDLLDDGREAGVGEDQVDQGFPHHQLEVLNGGLAHRPGREVPVVDDPGRGGEVGAAPVTEGAEVLPGVVAQSALTEPGQLGGTFSALEVLLGQTELRADVELQLAVVVPGAGALLLV